MINSRQLQAAKELAERQCEALRLWRALPSQAEAMFGSTRETLVRGGNRSLAAGTLVYKPNGEPVKIETLNVGDELIGAAVDDEVRGVGAVAITSRNDFDESTFTVVTDEGRTLCGVHDHPVWARVDNKEQWVLFRDLQPGQEVLACYEPSPLTVMKTYWDRVKSVTYDSTPKRIIAISTSLETYFSNGILSHNSGKSMCSAIRFAAIATDRPIYNHKGEAMEMRLPHQKGRCLTMWCIGYGEKHIGQTLYRLLFRSGSFNMIRDENTSIWRSFRPWDPNDQKRKGEVKGAPPLIPPRFIKGDIKWANRANHVFERVDIQDPLTGELLAEIYAFTSSGEVKAGDPVDEIWIDEAIQYPAHYPEWQARVIDREGRIWWSSWPQVSNEALRKISKRARDEMSQDTPAVREFILTMSGNPHLPEKAKIEASRGWSEDERMARDRGEFITDNLKMYPAFNRYIHRAVFESDREDNLSIAIRENGFMPPRDWTFEMILDPGTAHPAVLFCAIPPPELGDYYVPYDEIYIRNLDANQLADIIARKAEGKYFHRFIIDGRAARQTPMSFNRTIEANYCEALAKRNLRCHMTGSWFTYGSDNVSGRILTLQNWLVMQNQRFAKLRIVTENCPNLVEQMTQYEKKMVNGDVQEFSPAKGQNIDLAQTLEYWAASDPSFAYHPKSVISRSNMHRVYDDLVEKFGSRRRDEASETVVMGPAY